MRRAAPQLDAITIPPGDILCHTGDITFCARGGRTALADFNEQLRSLPHQHKVVIAGNHDKRIEQLGAQQVRKVLTAAHYLENNGVRLCGPPTAGTVFEVLPGPVPQESVCACPMQSPPISRNLPQTSRNLPDH